MFVYELTGCGFESSCSHLKFRFCACFKQGVPRHSGKYRLWINSETRKWHDKNIQFNPHPFCKVGGDPGMINQNYLFYIVELVIIKILNFKFENVYLLNFHKNIND